METFTVYQYPSFATEDAFAYEPLPNPNSLRLISIKIIQQADDLPQTHCTIKTFSLEDAPKYYALSYTWIDEIVLDSQAAGNDDEPAESAPPRMWKILLNERTFFVAVPLWTALVAMERRIKQDWLWVDAIGINQSDLAERASQVNLMGRIYTGASHVLVWLGLDENKEEAAIMNSIREIARATTRHGGSIMANSRQLQQNLSPYSHPSFMMSFGLYGWTEPRWKSIARFFHRRWFQRLWTLQEIVLGKLVVFFFGDSDVQWTEMYHCCWFLSITGLARRLLDLVPRPASSKKGSYLGANILAAKLLRDFVIAELESESTLASKKIASSTVSRFGGHEDPYANATTILLSLIHTSKDYVSTDSRDRIYALYGLLERACSKRNLSLGTFVSDYTKPVNDVYTDVAAAILEGTVSLGLLNLVGREEPTLDDKLPSWTPDFSNISPSSIIYPPDSPLGHTLRYNASKLRSTAATTTITTTITSPSPPFELSGRRLRVQSIHLGTVTQVGNTTAELVLRGTFEKSANVILHCIPTYNRATPPQPCLEALWRTMIADQGFDSSPAPEELRTGFIAFLMNFTLAHMAEAVGKGGRTRSDYIRTDLANLTKRADPQNPVPAICDADGLIKMCDEAGILEDRVEWSEVGRSPVVRQMQVFMMEFEPLANSKGGMRLFRCEDGNGGEGELLGLGPGQIREGDVLGILRGAETPFVLRTVDDEGSEGRKEYRLVGEAYVHGIMQGEALGNDEPKWEWIDLV